MRQSCVLAIILILVSAVLHAREVPSAFHHDRIMVMAAAPDGTTISLYTDTGGGYNAIRQSLADKFKLTEIGSAELDGQPAKLVAFPDFLSQQGVPRPSVERWLEGGLIVVPDTEFKEGGFLGTRWFADRVWEFDYPGKALHVHENWQPAANMARTPIGFHTNSAGVRDLSFPRITIIVDNEPIEMLLDTGATGALTKQSAPVFGLPIGTEIGTSYIIKSVFDRWANRHPNWRRIQNAEQVTGMPFAMIEVPSISIAGLSIGPVWFSQRPDADFQELMSPLMDKPIEGAVGGSGLKYLRLIVDYPNAMAYLQQPTLVTQ